MEIEIALQWGERALLNDVSRRSGKQETSQLMLLFGETNALRVRLLARRGSQQRQQNAWVGAFTCGCSRVWVGGSTRAPCACGAACTRAHPPRRSPPGPTQQRPRPDLK